MSKHHNLRVLALTLATIMSAGVETPGRAQSTFWADSRDVFDVMKDIRIGDSALLSFGGEFRERFESYAPPGFGLFGAKLDQYLLQRFLLGADLRVEESFRAYVQLIHAVQAGRNPVGPTDSNQGDLAQAYVEIPLPMAERRGGGLRVGRQEVVLGSQRLVSTRDGANARRAFDGFRLMFANDDVAIDGLALRPVTLRDGAFNDTTDQSQALWGLYTTWPLRFVPGLFADLYYLGFENRQATYGGVRGVEERHSIGIRLFGAERGWDWNFEGIYQFGSFAKLSIDAWTIASDSGFTFAELPWRPRLGLKANIASGNGGGSGRLGTFNPLYPMLPYFSQANLIVPANLFDVHPSLQVHPSDGLSLSVGWDFLWRESLSDAVYGPPYRAYPRTGLSSGRAIGNQIAVALEWQVMPHLAVLGSYVHFFAGEALTQAGGSDVDYVLISAAFRF